MADFDKLRVIHRKQITAGRSESEREEKMISWANVSNRCNRQYVKNIYELFTVILFFSKHSIIQISMHLISLYNMQICSCFKKKNHNSRHVVHIRNINMSLKGVFTKCLTFF